MKLITRAAAVGSAFALVLVGPAAFASDQGDAGNALNRELAANGDHFSVVLDGVDYPDYGVTLDAALGLNAAGVGKSRAIKARQYVEQHLGDYIGAGNETYSGSTAKALLTAQSQNVRPVGTLAGVDLVAKLKATETKAGRFSDKSAWGDYSNTFGQSLAMVALKRSGQTLSAASATYLGKQQCPNGGFRIQLAGSQCVANSKSDTDATAVAVQGLLATPESAARTTKINNAIGYLRSQMGADGGVKGGVPTNTPNSNSTGIAVVAFKATGNTADAAKGEGYLSGLQYGCQFPVKMRGLVSYDQARYDAVLAEGRTAVPNDQDRRATTQAILGFAGKTYSQISHVDSTAGVPAITC